MSPNISTIEGMISSVERHFQVEMKEIVSKSRHRVVTDARKAVVYFLRSNFALKDLKISEMIVRDRSAVGHMFNDAKFMIDHDFEFRDKINKIKSEGDISGICPCCKRLY